MIRRILALVVMIAVWSASPAGPPRGRTALASAQKTIDGDLRQSRDWKRARSANFEVVGDVDAGRASTIVSALETFRSALSTMFPGVRLSADVPTIVVALKKGSEFSRFTPRDEKGRRRNNVGGFFAQHGDLNYIVLPYSDESTSNPLNVLYHEYFHYISSLNTSIRPTWFNEGLSEVYSTFEYNPEQNRGIIGRPPAERINFLRSQTLLPLDQMLSSDGAAKLIRNARTSPLFYAQAWVFVHYLMIGRPGRERKPIEAYLEAIRKGITVEQAFRESFGVTFAEMKTELKRYIHQTGFPALYVRTPIEVSPTAVQVGSLTEAEALYIQGDVLARIGVDDDAEKILLKALKLQPSLEAARVALGSVRGHQKRYEEALDLIRPVADGQSATFRSHLELAGIYSGMDQHENALEAYHRATLANAASTAGWLGRCLTAMKLGKQEESDKALIRLQAIKPTPMWIHTRSYAAYHANRLEVAARDARAYIEAAGRGEEHSPYSAFLGAIAYCHLGRASEAAALLEYVRPGLTASTWQVDVMDFMQGRTTAPVFLSKAGDTEERTEAHAYIGIKAALGGNRDEALQHLRWVREHGTKTYVEYKMAETELKWLDNDAPAPVL